LNFRISLIEIQEGKKWQGEEKEQQDKNLERSEASLRP